MKLKCFFMFLFLGFNIHFVFSQGKKNNIDIYLSSMPDSTLFYLNEDKENIDSAFSTKGHIQFTYINKKGKPKGLILVSKNGEKGYLFWIENSSVNLYGNYNNSDALSAKGSMTQNEFKQYMELVPEEDEARLDSLESIFRYYQKKGNKDTSKLKDQITPLKEKIKVNNIRFIKSHPNSVISTYALLLATRQNGFTKEESRSLFNNLSKDQQNSTYGTYILKALQHYNNAKIGDLGPDFTMNDIQGIPRSLSDFTGKNVVLVFWASWCKPCLAEIPELKKAYESLKNKNFVFLTISLDEKKEAWQKAVKSNNLMQWINLSDFKGWASESAIQYDVMSIPSHILIDKDKKIIAKETQFSQLTNHFKKVTQYVVE